MFKKSVLFISRKFLVASFVYFCRIIILNYNGIQERFVHKSSYIHLSLLHHDNFSSFASLDFSKNINRVFLISYALSLSM